jgi:hypothetical protein
MSESFDELYLQPDLTAAEAYLLRAEHNLLLSPQADEFCRQIVQLGKLPSVAYEIAFAVLDRDTGEWVKPDHAPYQASKLLRNPDVVGRIKELREEIVKFGTIERAELIQTLKSLALDPDIRASDRIAATAQLTRMEGFNKEVEAGTGGTLIIQLPFAPNPLLTSPPMKLVEGITLDN